MMRTFGQVIDILNKGGVDYVLIGGVAAYALGLARLTEDIDIVYSRERANIERLARALAPLDPRLRVKNVPEGVPFLFDAETIWRGLNFTLVTRLGPLDILGEVAGAGSFESLIADSHLEMFEGYSVRCVRLTRLIELKRAAGRGKDLEMMAMLEALLEEREKRGLPI